MVDAQETKSPTMIESANLAAERLEKANAEMRANLARLDELRAFEKLGGTTEGRPAEAPKKEVNPIEYAKNVLSNKL